MSLLQVTTGKKEGAQIHVLAGINGVGKTTWVASAPSALILDLEDGSRHLDVARIEPDKMKDLASFRAIIKELITTRHPYKTIGIDSAEALEGLIFDAVCSEGKCESIEKYEGGYGKGYARAREIMREIMQDLQALRSKGITSVVIAHVQVKPHTDPALNQTYDKVIMRCNDKMAAIIRDLADNIFFATLKVATANDKGKTRAFGDGHRVMYTQPRPGYDAKNRLELPHELPLSYDAFTEYVTKAPESNVETLISDIKEIANAADAELKKAALAQLEKFKTNPSKLKEVKTRLMNAIEKGA